MTLRSIILCITTLCASHLLHAQDDDRITRKKSAFTPDGASYICSKIPAALTTGANAVVRNAQTTINIVSVNEVTVTRRYAVTVLNEDGNSYGAMNASYDKLSTIDNINGWLYDKDGNEINRIKKKSEILDVSASNSGFFNDWRTKHFSFPSSAYPYTCVYEIVKTYNNTFDIPSWDPQYGYDCAVEKADLEILYPRDIKINYRTYHTASEPVLTNSGHQNRITMTAGNMAPYTKPDEFTKIENYNTPAMAITCSQVALDTFTGNMDTWKNFGTFIYNLNAGRDKLPAGVVTMVHQLTDTCHTAKGKVTLLYEYLKKNTRYVSIQLGIGGWQTHEAMFVAEKGYGDCKALSNYMKALLKEAGIVSFQALVYGGEKLERTLDESFPSHAFNHVILCVPAGADTTWLECTSNDLPAGYLSSFTANRKVLLLTPAGGFVVKTPPYGRINTLIRTAAINIDEKDELQGNINARYNGWWWDMEHHITTEVKAKKESYFNSKFAIPTYQTGQVVLSSTDNNGMPALEEIVPVTGSGSISRSGKRVFFMPQIFYLNESSATGTESRSDSFQIFNDFQVSDTTVFKFAGAYTADKLVNDINYDKPFGTYHSKMTFENGNTLRVIATYTHKEGIYPAALFADYQKLCHTVNTNEAYGKIVLSKKE